MTTLSAIYFDPVTKQVMGFTAVREGDVLVEMPGRLAILSDVVPGPMSWVEAGILMSAPRQPSPDHVWDWNQFAWQLDTQADAKRVAVANTLAASDIDKAAEIARLRYITGGAGQEATYIRKESQAREWQASGFAGDAPSFIAAESAALGITAQALAEQVIALADYWGNVKGPQIEAARRKWKVAISTAANDLAAITAARDSGLAALDAL